MSFAYDEAVIPSWGPAPDPSSSGDIIKDALRKDKVIKEIAAAQGDLRALLERIKTVQKDVDKLTTGNETLQLYIDNLTMQMAKRR